MHVEVINVLQYFFSKEFSVNVTYNQKFTET